MSTYPRVCAFCLERPSAYRTKGGVYLCERCGAQYKQMHDPHKETPNLLDHKLQDPSVICQRCGLCCIMLNASVPEEEALSVVEGAQKAGHPETYNQVFHRAPIPRKPEGKRRVEDPDELVIEEQLTIRFPCSYLRGKPLQYVACAIYNLDRPKVCKTYICKIAILYGLGRLTPGEALFLLRSSFMSGDITVFNWLQQGGEIGEGEEEDKLLLYYQLNREARRLIQEKGYEREQAGLAVAARFVPIYDFRSLATRVLLNMHLHAYDRGVVEPRVYVDEEIVDGWSEEQHEFASVVITAMLKELRGLFEKVAEGKEENDEGQPTTEGGSSEGEGAASTTVEASREDDSREDSREEGGADNGSSGCAGLSGGGQDSGGADGEEGSAPDSGIAPQQDDHSSDGACSGTCGLDGSNGGGRGHHLDDAPCPKSDRGPSAMAYAAMEAAAASEGVDTTAWSDEDRREMAELFDEDELPPLTPEEQEKLAATLENADHYSKVMTKRTLDRINKGEPLVSAMMGALDEGPVRELTKEEAEAMSEVRDELREYLKPILDREKAAFDAQEDSNGESKVSEQG